MSRESCSKIVVVQKAAFEAAKTYDSPVRCAVFLSPLRLAIIRSFRASRTDVAALSKRRRNRFTSAIVNGSEIANKVSFEEPFLLSKVSTAKAS
jgi:hypothetical protein